MSGKGMREVGRERGMKEGQKQEKGMSGIMERQHLSACGSPCGKEGRNRREERRET